MLWDYCSIRVRCDACMLQSKKLSFFVTLGIKRKTVLSTVLRRMRWASKDVQYGKVEKFIIQHDFPTGQIRQQKVLKSRNCTYIKAKWKAIYPTDFCCYSKVSPFLRAYPTDQMSPGGSRSSRLDVSSPPLCWWPSFQHMKLWGCT